MVKALASYFLLLCCFVLKAQDIHYSQFSASPTLLNPAETGAINGDWRAGTHYRTQWTAVGRPFETISAQFDKRLFVLPDNLAVGLVISNDKSGTIQLNSTQVYLGSAYHKSFGIHTLGIGIQAGLVMKSYDPNGVTFPEQFDRDIGEFNAGLLNSESFLGDRLAHADFNLGMLYRRPIKEMDLRVGYAVQHFTSPRSSFFDRDVRLAPRQNIQTSLRIPLQNGWAFTPMIWYSRSNKAAEMLPTAEGSRAFPSNKIKAKEAFARLSFRDGFNRNSDAMVTTFGLRFKELTTALSYDINVGPFTEATGGRGALEFSLIYIAASSQVQKIVIPCDRF